MVMIPLLFVVFLLSLASAFQVGPRKLLMQQIHGSQPLPKSLQESLLFQSSSDNNEATSSNRRKRKRRRKQTVDSSVETSKTAEEKKEQQLKPRQNSAVSMQVTDIRELTGGKKPTTSVVSKDETPSQVSSGETAKTPVSESSKSSSGGADSLEMLLEDARQMQALEQKKKDDDSNKEEGGFAVPKMVRNAISTLVTVDFFLICIFLLWFLAGVFASYVLKDDAIQIAFNSIFQPVVQPALGILMIAALSSAIFKEEEEDDKQ